MDLAGDLQRLPARARTARREEDRDQVEGADALRGPASALPSFLEEPLDAPEIEAGLEPEGELAESQVRGAAPAEIGSPKFSLTIASTRARPGEQLFRGGRPPGPGGIGMGRRELGLSVTLRMLSTIFQAASTSSLRVNRVWSRAWRRAGAARRPRNRHAERGP